MIGGGVTLLGNPVGAAVPVTTTLLSEYESWLYFEEVKLARELRPGMPPGNLAGFYGLADKWHRADPGKPSDRAAVVLASVGCDWKEGV